MKTNPKNDFSPPSFILFFKNVSLTYTKKQKQKQDAQDKTQQVKAILQSLSWRRC